MKVKGFFFFVFLCFSLVIFSSDCFAQVSTSSELLNNAKKHDGKTVNYRGEVIGDVMIRGDHAWLHVNDGSIAIGIWASNDIIQDIRYIGDYHQNGDIVEVFGTFHRSCLEHGGDLDIHAQTIKIIAPGFTINPPINKRKICLGIILLIVVLPVYALKELFRGRKE